MASMLEALVDARGKTSTPAMPVAVAKTPPELLYRASPSGEAFCSSNEASSL